VLAKPARQLKLWASMIIVYGRNRNRYRYSRKPPAIGEQAIPYEPFPPVAWLIEQPGAWIQGNNLGEVLTNFGVLFDVRIVPDDSPKYFLYFELGDGKDDVARLVDIHVNRRGDEICPKQDLTFPLKAGDIVEILQCIC
jgi:hypothetical protein